MESKEIRQKFKRQDYLLARHSVANIVRLLMASGLLVLWFYWAKDNLSFFPYVLFSAFFCLIHQRELSEWIHEAAHYNLHHDRIWNDRLIHLLAGFFFANDIKVHRFGHMRHHRQDVFFVESDPDTRLLGLKSKHDFWRCVLSDLFGVTAIRMFTDRTGVRCPNPTKGFYFQLIIFQALVLFVAWKSDRFEAYVVYYATLMTLYPLLNRLRLYGQHMSLTTGTAGGYSRTIDAGVQDRILFTSKLMMYHYEHHAYPDLPFRALHEMPRTTTSLDVYSKTRWKLMWDLYSSLPRN